MADLNTVAFDTEAARKLIIGHPSTGQPIYDQGGNPAYVEVLSTDSKTAQKHQREQTNRMLAKRNRNKVTADEIDASSVELLAALTKGWHLVNFDGEVIDYEFTVANARALYSSAKFRWLREQVDEFAGDRANFLES